MTTTERIQQLRSQAQAQREAAVSHYKWSVHCPSVESNAWWQAGYEADTLALDLDRQADLLQRRLTPSIQA